jgi:hypothetical protein
LESEFAKTLRQSVEIRNLASARASGLMIALTAERKTASIRK